LPTLLVALTTHAAHAVITPGQQLAIAHISNTINGLSAIKNSLNIELGYVNIPDFTLISPLFEQYNLTPADVGRTFLANPQNDPDFNSFVGFLTDGSNEYLGAADDVGGAGANLESMFWTQRPPGNNGIDLRTFPVGSITMHVDS